MATFSTAAAELKYASGSTWTSGKARQGVYSSTRYEGAINFSGLSGLDMSNVDISEITLSLTFGNSGGASNKYVYFYKATGNTITGSISAMRADSIGTLYVEAAYNGTRTLTFNASTNADMFAILKEYLLAGNRVLILYAPKTRGTYSGGYCYDYLSVTAANLTLTYQYLKSSGTLEKTSIAAGSTAKLNIAAYNTAYKHKVTWKFGSYSNTQTVAAGTTSASYAIPLTWLNAIPSATSGAATVTLETLNASGTSLGTATYSFTITAPASVAPTISGVTATPVNTNSVIDEWELYVYGKTKATLTIDGAAGAYGSTIKSYSISTSPAIGNSTQSSFTTGLIYQSGTITVTAKVTDSRGRTATKTTTFYVYPYAKPTFSSTTVYRCLSSGTQDDINGTYGYVEVSYACSVLAGGNAVTGKAVLTQVGGSFSTSAALTSGTAVILGNGALVSDSSYSVTITLTDTVGSTSTYTATINSAAYCIHVKKGGKAIGFGMAAGDEETASFAWMTKFLKNIALGNDQNIYGYDADGKLHSALIPWNANGNTVLGIGTYNAESGYTNIYGNRIQLLAKGGYIPVKGALGFSFENCADLYWEDASGTGHNCMNLNENNTLDIGYGLWNTGTGKTSVRGNTLELYAKSGATRLMGSDLRLDNGRRLFWLDTSGTAHNCLQLNTSNDLVLGYGGYSAGVGGTHIYGTDVKFGIKNANSASYTPYYRKGDSITLEYMVTAGYTTNSKHEIYFTVPLPNPVIGSPTVTVTSVGGFKLRQNNAYTHGSAANTFTTPTSYTTKLTAAGIYIGATFSDTTNAVNNAPIGVHWSGKITFS